MTAWVKLEPGIPALDHPTGWRAIERLETASISLVDPHRDISQQKILCVAASLFSVHDREALCRCIERWQHPVTSVTVYRCVQCGQCGQCGLLLRRHQEHWTLPGLAPLSSGPQIDQMETAGWDCWIQRNPGTAGTAHEMSRMTIQDSITVVETYQRHRA